MEQIVVLLRELMSEVLSVMKELIQVMMSIL